MLYMIQCGTMPNRHLCKTKINMVCGHWCTVYISQCLGVKGFCWSRRGVVVWNSFPWVLVVAEWGRWNGRNVKKTLNSNQLKVHFLNESLDFYTPKQRPHFNDKCIRVDIWNTFKDMFSYYSGLSGMAGWASSTRLSQVKKDIRGTSQDITGTSQDIRGTSQDIRGTSQVKKDVTGQLKMCHDCTKVKLSVTTNWIPVHSPTVMLSLMPLLPQGPTQHRETTTYWEQDNGQKV